MTPLGLPSLDRISALPADVLGALRMIPEIVENPAAMKEHTAQLSELMERILTAVAGLSASVETLQGAVEPMARLASRMPGQKKG
ncbi:MAG: hypothetical protein WA862_10060 [Solirubrobacterales bacterium]